MELTLDKRLRVLTGPILITDHMGFKGTWLTFLLGGECVPVVGFPWAPEHNSLFNRAKRLRAIPETFETNAMGHRQGNNQRRETPEPTKFMHGGHS